jgi:hypothetical protein
MALAVALMIIVRNEAMAQGYHQLTPADFQGIPKPRIMGHVAYTNCTIDFRYSAFRDRDGSYKLYATVQLMLNRDRCWLDTRNIVSKLVMDEVINHEQGHYIIAYMEQQELLRQINRTRFTRNYKAEAMQLFDAVDAKYKELNESYETATQHMQNKVEQRSWDDYFRKRLDTAPPLAQNGY